MRSASAILRSALALVLALPLAGAAGTAAHAPDGGPTSLAEAGGKPEAAAPTDGASRSRTATAAIRPDLKLECFPGPTHALQACGRALTASATPAFPPARGSTDHIIQI